MSTPTTLFRSFFLKKIPFKFFSKFSLSSQIKRSDQRFKKRMQVLHNNGSSQTSSRKPERIFFEYRCQSQWFQPILIDNTGGGVTTDMLLTKKNECKKKTKKILQKGENKNKLNTKRKLRTKNSPLQSPGPCSAAMCSPQAQGRPSGDKKCSWEKYVGPLAVRLGRWMMDGGSLDRFKKKQAQRSR